MDPLGEQFAIDVADVGMKIAALIEPMKLDPRVSVTALISMAAIVAQSNDISAEVFAGISDLTWDGVQ